MAKGRYFLEFEDTTATKRHMISKNHWKGAQTTRSRLVPSDGRGMEADLVAMEDVWGLEPKIMEGEEVSKSGQLKN